MEVIILWVLLFIVGNVFLMVRLLLSNSFEHSLILLIITNIIFFLCLLFHYY